MVIKNYYQILGVDREASGEEIKKAYRKLAMEYHPDRNQDRPGCEEYLKEINEAYQVLGDEGKRRQYDLWRQQPFYRRVDYPEDLSDDLIEFLRLFSRRSFGLRGLGGCKGRGLGKRGCRRWKDNF